MKCVEDTCFPNEKSEEESYERTAKQNYTVDAKLLSLADIDDTNKTIKLQITEKGNQTFEMTFPMKRKWDMEDNHYRTEYSE